MRAEGLAPAVRRGCRIALGVWGVLVVLWSLFPSPPAPQVVQRLPGADLTAHFLAYLMLGWLAAGSLGARGKPWMLASAAFAAGLGALLELAQPLAGRTCEASDILADSAGAVAGTLLWWAGTLVTNRTR